MSNVSYIWEYIFYTQIRLKFLYYKEYKQKYNINQMVLDVWRLLMHNTEN